MTYLFFTFDLAEPQVISSFFELEDWEAEKTALLMNGEKVDQISSEKKTKISKVL